MRYVWVFYEWQNEKKNRAYFLTSYLIRQQLWMNTHNMIIS